jgi:carboxylesterase type B
VTWAGLICQRTRRRNWRECFAIIFARVDEVAWRTTSVPHNRGHKDARWEATAELAFVFDNTKLAQQGTGNTPEAQSLAKKMAGAWAAFPKTGNPGQPDLPWPAFDPAKGNTMVFDNTCRMVDDPLAEARKILLT